MLEFDENVHWCSIESLTKDLKKLGLQVVEGDTVNDPKNYKLETPLSIYFAEIVDGYIDENKAYIPVYETTPVCDIVMSNGEVEKCLLSPEFANTSSSSKFNLLSKLYELLYNN